MKLTQLCLNFDQSTRIFPFDSFFFSIITFRYAFLFACFLICIELFESVNESTVHRKV